MFSFTKRRRASSLIDARLCLAEDARRRNKCRKRIAVCVSSVALICGAHAQDYAGRKELKRSDLTGNNMEVIVSISETKPGETLPRHFHNGEEAFYTLDDTTIELPDGKQVSVNEVDPIRGTKDRRS